MSSLKAIRNHIIFKFEREVVSKTDNGQSRSQFKEETNWGFQINSFDDGTKAPQWGIAVSVGPEVKEVKEGDRILITALQWTNAVEFGNEKVWRTDEDQVLAVDDSYSS